METVNSQLKIDPRNYKILVVDDEVMLRKAIAFDLIRKGFQVLDVENGTKAFEIVGSHKIDLVLTDVRMPDGDGVSLLDKIKSNHPELPVVMFITGFTDISVEEAYDRGVDAVFPKPFDRKQLFSTIVRALSPKEEQWGYELDIPASDDFSVDIEFSNLDEAVRGKILSIGRGGMFVALDGPFPTVGAMASFKINFEKGKPQDITGRGEVKWLRAEEQEGRRPGCGIKFEFLEPTSRDAIIELINVLMTKSFIPKG